MEPNFQNFMNKCAEHIYNLPDNFLDKLIGGILFTISTNDPSPLIAIID
jgi:hypothetical protein